MIKNCTKYGVKEKEKCERKLEQNWRGKILLPCSGMHTAVSLAAKPRICETFGRIIQS